ncbi:hypothetical protein RSPO_c00044 [Ralstonia solanacearum Po82]|uniref:Uncharacterized protein n=1 Tax=Ralstonia solanacearum (strain Po82) TaxID=1031711 RepID=F6G4T9_RALS8|nr:hypothetical protein RSPO_c00044 [Ralstonia solanacearum Po82]
MAVRGGVVRAADRHLTCGLAVSGGHEVASPGTDRGKPAPRRNGASPYPRHTRLASSPSTR